MLNLCLKSAKVGILDADCINVAVDFTTFLDADKPHFSGSNPRLGCLMQNLPQKSDVTFFFSPHRKFEIRGVVHYVNYSADFPFK